MPKLIIRAASYLIPVALVVGYISFMGGTGRCAACQAVVHSAMTLTGFEPEPETAAQPESLPDTRPVSVSGAEAASDAAPAFRRVARPGSVDIKETYDVTDARIPLDEVHTLLPKDAIPALTDPETRPVVDASWLPDQARLIAVTAGEGDAAETLGVPLVILNWHEIVNTTVGGEPVAATYCPLCDSATVFSRRVGGDEPTVLEFGVSGALYNSNVLMYDRQGLGLWSQLAMRAVTGNRAGTELAMLPLRMMTFGEFKAAYPGARIVSKETGHERNYDWAKRPYQDFFSNDRTLVPLRAIGSDLPKKTLGVGISSGRNAWFVTDAALKSGERTVETPRGPVTVSRTDAGIFVQDAPPGVRTVQAFYYAWSAFNPETAVIGGAD